MTRRNHIVHEGYQHRSRYDVPLQREPGMRLALILYSLPGGLLLLGLFAVATLLIVILSPAASDASPRASASSVRVAEAGADKGSAR